MELSGPIRMAKMSAHTLSLGLLPFLYLMALISIAVGIMNLLPIPGLDGGHLLTYAVEGVMRRDLPEAAATLLIQGGLLIIIAMGVLGITLDVIRSEEHTSELQSLMRISYPVFCLKQKRTIQTPTRK